MKLDDLKARLRRMESDFHMPPSHQSMRNINAQELAQEAIAKITDLEALVGELGEALTECASDLEAELAAKGTYDTQRKMIRDLISVAKARATLAKLEKARG